MSVVSLQTLDSVHNEGGDGALSSGPNNPATEGIDVNNEAGTFHPGARFWAIIFALCVSAICSSLEGTIVSTALPSIVRDLGGGEKFLWAANAYFLTR